MSERGESIPLKDQAKKAKMILETDNGKFKYQTDSGVNDVLVKELVKEIDEKYKHKKRGK